MKATRSRATYLQVSVILIAMIAVFTSARRPRATAHAPLTAQQISVKAAPICRLLSGAGQTLEQTVDERFALLADGKKHKVWAVECGDMQEHNFVCTVWDAETGDLIYAVHMANRQEAGTGAPVSAARAADVAWQWMGRLRVATMGARWDVKNRPTLDKNSWHVVMRSADLTSTVVFDSHTQNLVYIIIKRNKDAVKA